jgi:drug/metabolite transporter (DMT)-like permease
MKPGQILGGVVFAIGIVLLIFAYNASNAPVDQLVNTFTGHYTNQTMWYLMSGIAAAVGGGLIFLFGRRS